MLLDLLYWGIRAVSWWLTCSVHIAHARTVVRGTTISWAAFLSGYAEPCWVGPWRSWPQISPLYWMILHHNLRSMVPDCKWLFPEQGETFGDQQPCYVIYVVNLTHHTSPSQKQSRSFWPFLSISLSAQKHKNLLVGKDLVSLVLIVLRVVKRLERTGVMPLFLWE